MESAKGSKRSIRVKGGMTSLQKRPPRPVSRVLLFYSSRVLTFSFGGCFTLGISGRVVFSAFIVLLRVVHGKRSENQCMLSRHSFKGPSRRVVSHAPPPLLIEVSPEMN